MNRQYLHQAQNYLGATIVSLVFLMITFGLDFYDDEGFTLLLRPVLVAVTVISLISYCIFYIKAYDSNR